MPFMGLWSYVWMDQMAPPSPSLPDPVRRGVSAQDIANIDRICALAMAAAEALTVAVQRDAAEGRLSAALNTAALAKMALVLQRGVALKAKVARDARQADREAAGEGRRGAEHPRTPRLRQLVGEAITGMQAGPSKTARLLRSLETRLDCFDLGAELTDRPLAQIAMDMCHGLNVPTAFCVYTDEEIAEARAVLDRPRGTEDEDDDADVAWQPSWTGATRALAERPP